MVLCFVLVLACIPAAASAQEAPAGSGPLFGPELGLCTPCGPHGGPRAPQARPRELSGDRGAPASERVGGAAGAEPPGSCSNDPFARRSWHLELGSHGALETWNYNISHEEMLSGYAGIAYGVGRGVVLRVGAPLYYVWQRGTNGWLFGLTWGARGRMLRRDRWSLFWEVDVGISESDTYVPPRGTRFNYLALGGAGVAVRLASGVHGIGGLRWVHVSNGGLAGRDRNPDIEAVGPTIGVLLKF